MGAQLQLAWKPAGTLRRPHLRPRSTRASWALSAILGGRWIESLSGVHDSLCRRHRIEHGATPSVIASRNQEHDLPRNDRFCVACIDELANGRQVRATFVAGAFVARVGVAPQVRHLVDRAIRIARAERRVTAIIIRSYSAPPVKSSARAAHCAKMRGNDYATGVWCVNNSATVGFKPDG